MHRAQVTGNVSGRTTFLLVGRYAGRTKFFTAKVRLSSLDMIAC